MATDGEERPARKFTVHWMEEIIQDAMKKGKFQDLPGKGKPLDLEQDEPDPYAQEGSWVVNRVLRNNKAAPLWVELEKAIREDRQWLASHPKEHPERPSRLVELNEKILLFNLNKPRGVTDKPRVRE